MGQRPRLTCRVDPAVLRLIRRVGEKNGVSDGRVVEMMAGKLWRGALTDGWKAGMRVTGDNVKGEG